MGLKLWAHKSIKTNGHAQDGNVDLGNHPRAPYHHLLNNIEFWSFNY